MRHALWIGDHRHHEFLDAVGWLTENSRLTLSPDPHHGLTRIARQGLQPDLVVFGQSHPGQYRRDDAERVHREVPLARLVTLLGSWCEGGLRRDAPWPGVVRLYWHQLAARVDRDFLRGRRPAPAAWALPRTSTDAERWLTQWQSRRPAGDRQLIIVHARNLAAYQSLADALEQEGYATMWVTPEQQPLVGGPLAGIWEGDVCRASDRAELESFAELLHPAPVIAVVNFPRLSDARELREAGAAAVLAKPYLLHDLLVLLRRQSDDVSHRVARASAA